MAFVPGAEGGAVYTRIDLSIVVYAVLMYAFILSVKWLFKSLRELREYKAELV